MAQDIPVTLTGNKLGERHRHLNNLVNKAHLQNVQIETILESPENLPIDRVYKIKLASKHRHAEFVIKNLKEKDMLYVSKALSCLWLLEPAYRHIVNPEYLERHLYPEMITTAVSKMKNVIELRLREPERCQEFYEYYKSDFKVSIKFLWHCSKDFIIKEITNIIDKLNPKHLRILCETCPQVAKLYMEGLQNNKLALRNYFNKRRKYWNSILKVLKLDGMLFLDLIEKYFDHRVLHSLSSSATKYIMKNYKNRYLAKPELYAAWLLDAKTLGKYLTHEEIKDIVLRLARAKYLNSLYTYKSAEPFLKRLPTAERALLKKQLFVDKNIGTKIANWPYTPPKDMTDFDSSSGLLVDIEHDPNEYEDSSDEEYCDSNVLKRRKLRRSCEYQLCSLKYCSTTMHSCKMPQKTSLELLFDRYRFVNFEKTFFEFKKLLLTEGTIEGRRNMLLVLVSKTGGSEAKLEQLLKFLVERHSNEPVNLRDAIARSMVKRAFVWRVATETWDLLLKWATTSVSEILHSKVLRHLLVGSTCPPHDVAAYLLDFSDFTAYSLNSAESACIVKQLPALLISVDAPMKLLDTLKAYKLRIGAVPGAEEFLVSAARNNEEIFMRLYKSRVGRKHLLKESFKITQHDAAYVNVLKHDVSLLANGERLVTSLLTEKPRHDRFLRALVLYFPEAGGLAAQHCLALKNAITAQCRLSFARAFAYLFNFDEITFQDYINKLDIKTLDSNQKKFAAAVNANAFVVRPLLDIDVLNWHSIGAKFICNKLMICNDRNVDKYISKSLSWKKTMKVALRLSMRNGSAISAFAVAVEVKPIAVLKVVISEIHKDTLDLQRWNLVKPVISNLDFSKKSLRHVKRSLSNYNFNLSVKALEADYWATVFGTFRKVSERAAIPILCKIENLFTEVDESILKEIISEILITKLEKGVATSHKYPVLALYFRLIAKYLLTCQSEHEQKIRMEKVCDPFFYKIDILWNDNEDNLKIKASLSDFLYSLKYNKAFLDRKYVSCIPMLERILENMGKTLHREQHFTKYVRVYMIRLYCRSVREAVLQKPELFENPKLIKDDAVNLIGFLMGKYIGMEIHDLVQSSYQSVIELYQPGVVKFFRECFEHDQGRIKMVKAVIRSLTESGVESQLVAQYLLKKERSNIEDDDKEEILKLLKDSKHEEVKFFLYAKNFV